MQKHLYLCNYGRAITKTASQEHGLYSFDEHEARDTCAQISVGHGFRYRLNNPRLPGHPDIVLRKYRTCVFVNGCFWHGHEGCKYFRMPKTNTDFWEKKIKRNKERDKEEQRQLAKMGWHCITVWECELKPKVRDKTLEALAFTLNHIFIEDRSIKYKLPEDDDLQIAAEPLEKR